MGIYAIAEQTARMEETRKTPSHLGSISSHLIFTFLQPLENSTMGEAIHICRVVALPICPLVAIHICPMLSTNNNLTQVQRKTGEILHMMNIASNQYCFQYVCYQIIFDGEKQAVWVQALSDQLKRDRL